MIPDSIQQISCDVIGGTDVAVIRQLSVWAHCELMPRIPGNARIISLDGWNGVGKTTLGRVLATSISSRLIDLDDYLNRNQGKFLAALRSQELARTIEERIAQQGRVVVAGCLIDLALQQSKIAADHRIYVMRLSGMVSNPDVETIDEFDALYGDKSADALIAEADQQVRLWAELSGQPIAADECAVPELECELIWYHKQHRPHDFADLIVRVIRRA